ncbi:MAG TPA: efflux RND transporter periplasmic adaptor subunit [Blastocatellia bacterium]|nr:efflux RND transporter periplasmic adaptor subunit [Blastocatellia bacterium]
MATAVNNSGMTAGHRDLRVVTSRIGRRRYLAAAILVAAIAVVVYFNVAPRLQAGAGQPVRLGKVKTGDLSVEVLATGTVEPRQEFEVRSPYDMALVESSMVKPGDKVEKGQLMIQLANEPIIESVSRARSEFLEAKLRLAEKQDGSYEAQEMRLRFAVERAERDLEFKTSRVARNEELSRAGLISRVEMTRLENEAEMAKLALKEAQLELHTFLGKSRDQDIASAKAQVEFRQAALDRTSANLAASSLKAPFSGVVLGVLVNPGGVLRYGDIAVKMADMHHFRVSASVDELEVGRLTSGQQAIIRSEYFGSAELKGAIERIVPTVRSERGVASVQVLIDTAATTWDPPAGMTVDVRIRIDRAENVRTVPLEAIVQRRGKSVVFVCENGQAHAREVVVGLRNESEVEVIQGLGRDETIVVGGHVFLQDGDKIRAEGKESASGLKVDLFK